MKIKTLICSALAMTLLTGCVNIRLEGHEHHDKCGKCERHEEGKKWNHRDHDAKQAKLMAEAKVTKEAAEQTALAKVTNGKIKESELEMEKGKLQWSFDMTTPDSKDITEVNIDAKTGAVISVQKESAESEAKEAGESGGKWKHGDNDEDND